MRKQSIKLWLLRATAVFCACLCLFSAVMTSTYAWQSQQGAVNDIWGDADTMVPVILTKLEMTADGKRTENPIEGAVFYLYKEDGTQIGVQYVTDENGTISLRLPVGKYYFEESSPPYGYTYPLDETGTPVTCVSFEVEEQSEPYEPVELTVYNRRLSGDLVISKLVENSDGTPLTDEQRALNFTFTVTFTDNGVQTQDTYTYTVNNGEPQHITSGGTLTLRSGEAAVFEDLPAGLLYHVTESPVAGYQCTATGHQGNIQEDNPSLAAFVNTYQSSTETGVLVITKEVRNSDGSPLTEAQKEMPFTFTVMFGEVAEEFTLKHGESKSFPNIEVGTQYLVMEELSEESKTEGESTPTDLKVPAEGYIALMDTYSGTMEKAQVVTLPFVNVFSSETPEETGELVVKKTVPGSEGNGTDYFTFAVTFQGENAPEDPEPFMLKAGEERVFENIPHGVTYTVIEANAAGYKPAWQKMQGTIVGGETAEVEAINTVPGEETPEEHPETVTISVRKSLEGNPLPSDYEKSFNMTMYINGQPTETFSLLPSDANTPTNELTSEQVHKFNIPYGITYELREEDYFSQGFSQSIANGVGIATEDTVVEVTNTYVGVPKVEIRGTKTWVIPEGSNPTLPEFITIQLTDGEKIVATQELRPDVLNGNEYCFIVPRYSSDGSSEIVYGVMELPVEGFHTGSDSENVYNIINTYVEPITDNDPPIIIKEIKGDNAPVEKFTFVFEAKTDGAPMPEGSVGNKKKITMTGGGEVEIGSITFTKAGTYTYTVYEEHGGVTGWTYDTVLYTIIYTVTEEKETHQLSMARTIAKNDAAVEGLEEFLFVNNYHDKNKEMVTISGVKTWNHRGNPVSNRPSSVVIEVYGDGILAWSKRVTADDDWHYSVSLEKYDDAGHIIQYTVDEQTVSGYSKVINGYNITNTYRGTTPVYPVNPDPTPDEPDTPDTPTPEKPEKPDGSADTGDDSRVPFWLMMTLVSMLGTVFAVSTLRANSYEGKRVKKAR